MYSALVNRKGYGWIEAKTFENFQKAIDWTYDFLRAHADEYNRSGFVECKSDHSHMLVMA